MAAEWMGARKVPRLFSTKTRVPLPPPGFLSRPRLLADLREGITRKLTILIAPAGFGKTTVLAELARSLGPAAAWLSLDPSDRDLSVFATYLVEAIAQVHPGFGAETRAWLAATPAPALQIADFAAIFLGELEEIEAEQLVLFLDDIHEVYESDNITTLLDTLTRYLPPDVHVVLGGRAAPPVQFTKLIVQQQVVAIGTDALRYHLDEAADWYAARTGQRDAAVAARLVEASEGWVTGMVLQSATDARPVLLGAGDSQLYAFLSAEVLERQPSDIRSFLLRSSVLTDLAVPIVNTVLDITNTALLLERIRDRQLFLTAVGGREAPAYRLHQLFREFLADRLQTTDPAEFKRLHGRAATVYEQQADFGQAMEHLFAGGDWERAARLAVRVGPGELEAGRGERIEFWIARFPAAQRDSWPALLLLEARLLAAQAQYGPAADVLAHGEHLLLDAGDQAGYAEARALRARLSIVGGDGLQIVEYAQQALAVSEATALTYAQAYHMAGIGYSMAGTPARADECYTAALEQFSALGDRQGIALVASDWGFALAERQELELASVQLEKALAYAREMHNLRLEARVLSNRATVHQARGELQMAQDLLAPALTIARQLRWRRVEAEILLSQADIALVLVGPQAALRLYEETADVAGRGSPTTLVRARAGQAGCLRHLGRYADAARIARRALETAQTTQMSFELALCRLELGAALLPHAPEEALPLLVDAELEMLALGRKSDAARAAAALATALAATYDYLAAAAALERAAVLAEELGGSFFLAPELATAAGLPLLRYADRGSGRYAGLLAAVTRYLETENKEAAAAESRPGGPLQLVRGRPRVLEVYTFGTPAVYRDGLALAKNEWATAVSKELFYYLLEYPEGRRKESILADLWPDSPVDKANTNFHGSLSRLRAAVGGEVARLDDTVYRISSDLVLWHDGTEVLALMARARRTPNAAIARRWWSAAAALLKGSYVEEFYRDWVSERRQFWEARTKEVLSWLADDAFGRRAFDEAVTWAQRLLALDPLDESVHMLLMRIYAFAGQPVQLSRQYRELCQVLDNELGAAPSPEARALYQRLRGAGPLPG